MILAEDSDLSPTAQKPKTISKLRISDDINYLKSGNGEKESTPQELDDYQTILSPESEPNHILGTLGGSEKYLPKPSKKEKSKKKKKKRRKPSIEDKVEILPVVEGWFLKNIQSNPHAVGI